MESRGYLVRKRRYTHFRFGDRYLGLLPVLVVPRFATISQNNQHNFLNFWWNFHAFIHSCTISLLTRCTIDNNIVCTCWSTTKMLEFRCYHEYKQIQTVCHIYFRLQARIWFPTHPTSNSVLSSSVILPDPENMGIAVGFVRFQFSSFHVQCRSVYIVIFSRLCSANVTSQCTNIVLSLLISIFPSITSSKYLLKYLF